MGGNLGSSNVDRADVLESSFLGGTVTVGTTEVEAKVGASRLDTRQLLTIYNASANTIYWGPTGVTTSTGQPIEKKQFVSIPAGNIAVYLIAASAGNTAIVQEWS